MLIPSSGTNANQVLPIHNGNNLTPRSTQKTAYLDGLRGIAALLVYLQHHTVYFYTDFPGIELGFGAKDASGTINHQFASLPIIRLLYTGGSAAVAVFFVLSGYLLSRKPLQQISEHQYSQCSASLKSASVRRPLRLYLPLIAVVVSFAVWLHLPFGLAPKVNMPAKQANLFAELTYCAKELALYLNPFQQHGWYVAWFPYNGTLWTIPIELKGSMLVFGLLYLIGSPIGQRMEKYWSFLLRILAYILLAADQWAMSLFVYGLVLSMHDIDRSTSPEQAGTVFAKTYPRLQHLLRHIQLFTALYLLSQPVKGRDATTSSNTPGWYYLTSLIPKTYLKDEYYRFYQSIGAVMLVHVVLRISWLQTLFSSEAALYLGRVSFSFYLVHIPILWVYGDRAQRLIGVHGRNWNGPLWVDRKLAHLVPDVGPVGLSTRFVVAIWAVLPIVLAISELSTRYLDEPSIKLSRWISWKLGLEQPISYEATDARARRQSSAKPDSKTDRTD